MALRSRLSLFFLLAPVSAHHWVLFSWWKRSPCVFASPSFSPPAYLALPAPLLVSSVLNHWSLRKVGLCHFHFFSWSAKTLLSIATYPEENQKKKGKVAPKKKKESPAADVGKAKRPMVQCPACQSPFGLPVADLPTNPLVLTALSSLAAAAPSSSSSSSSPSRQMAQPL